MKTLFEYKKSLIDLKKPEEELEKVFKKICNLLISWGIDLNSIDISNKCNPIDLKDDFDKVFLENFIISSLKLDISSPIWSNIFKITKVESYNHYGDITIYDIVLKSKLEKIKEIPGIWVYENYNQVKLFLSENNLQYDRLVNIKKLFPIQIL